MMEDPQTTARAVIALLDDATSGLESDVSAPHADRSH
jgi:hypothetical protein